MELLNIAFIILLLKITFCVLPGVLGFFLIFSSQSTKRRMRNIICSQLFGFSHAIRTYKFARFLYATGVLSVLLSLTASWFFVLRVYIQSK